MSRRRWRCRRRQVGDIVTYVVNRNINFTNVCVEQLRANSAAFSREYREEQGYFLPMEEIVRRAQEAVDMGATENVHASRLTTKDGRSPSMSI